MDAKPLGLWAVTSFMAKRGTASDHNAPRPGVEYTVTQFALPSKWPLSTWLWSECPCKPHACPRCLRHMCVSCFYPLLDRVLAMTQEVPVRDTVAFKTVRCMTPQPRRHGLGCVGNTAAAHIFNTYWLLDTVRQSPRGLYAAHMSLFRRPWRLYNELVIAGRLAGPIPIEISRFVISRNRLTCTWRASVWYSKSLEFSFLSCFVLQLYLALGMTRIVLDLQFFRPWLLVLSLFWFWSSSCLPLVLVLSLSACDFDPQPVWPWFWFSACLPLVLVQNLFICAFAPKPVCPWFWSSACMPLVLVLSLSASGFDPQPVCPWFWSSACLPLVLVQSLFISAFARKHVCPWFWFSACLPLVLILSLSASGFDPQPVCLWFWSSACLPLVLVQSLIVSVFAPKPVCP